MASSTWAISQLSRLLPLDEDSIKQIIDYSSSLSKDAAAEHLKNLLGDSSQALEFIATFNARRETPKEAPTLSAPPEVPRPSRKKGKPPLNKLPPPRRPEDYGNTSGAYKKKEEENYIPSNQSSRTSNSTPISTPLSSTLSLTTTPTLVQRPKQPPSAAGSLISDLPNVRTTSRNPSQNPSRTSSPAKASGKTKIALSGGTPMHGASTALSDLDSAIRALETQTNPSLSPSPADNAARKCDCLATRHPLLAAAPNCLNCGKIICVREGLGPCTFCNTPLLSPAEIQDMVRALKEERGREKMDANNASQRRADVSQTPKPFQTPKAKDEDEAASKARAHRDKLLMFQAQNARRTHVIDEAADFETPASGQSIWTSPVDRAAQLKRQQKVLREQEWNARPEWEKRRVVVSVDLVGGKVVRRMGEVERPREEAGWVDEEVEEVLQEQMQGKGTGAFGRNPLLGGLIRPVWKAADGEGEGKGKGKEGVDGEGKENRERSVWRRVQDDDEDNEAWILDGGVYGGRVGERRLGDEERACG
ncbi:hypothetical protein MMC30_004386 [Trapelia coarctata]|nr:hypothetical protein [Trapelia coarctata]